MDTIAAAAAGPRFLHAAHPLLCARCCSVCPAVFTRSSILFTLLPLPSTLASPKPIPSPLEPSSDTACLHYAFSFLACPRCLLTHTRLMPRSLVVKSSNQLSCRPPRFFPLLQHCVDETLPDDSTRPSGHRYILVRLLWERMFFMTPERALPSLRSCYGRFTRARLH